MRWIRGDRTWPGRSPRAAQRGPAPPCSFWEGLFLSRIVHYDRPMPVATSTRVRERPAAAALELELRAPWISEAVRTGLAFGAALAASLVVVLLQPVASPWWIYADADATYVANAADLMAGEHTFYLDHPGLPLQELMAATFEVRYALHKIFLGPTSPHEYAAAQMLDLDGSRVYWRTFAALFYLFGAGVAFVVCRRYLGHWGFGLAGGLLWIAAPGLVDMSIQYRPDVLLSGLALLVGYLI